MAAVVHTVNGVPTSVVGDDGTNWEFTVQEDTPAPEAPVEPATAEVTEPSVEETPAGEVAEEATETPAGV